MSNNTGKYGLPLNVKFCKTCTMNNQRPSSTLEFKQKKDESKKTISFNDDGNISSTDSKFTYTINTCRLNRTYLKDRRKKIIDDLRRDLRATFVENATPFEQTVAIKTIVTKFMADWRDVENEFLAFRRYVIDHWLANDIKYAKN